MKTIILIQHTESEHHVNHHIGAQYEWNLTARGREQAFRIGKWLKREGCDQTWSMFVSPQIRAQQTAEEINRSLGISPVIREELREVNAGMGNGKTREWYRMNAAPRGAVFDPDHRDFPDAESDRELWNRVLPFLSGHDRIFCRSGHCCIPRNNDQFSSVHDGRSVRGGSGTLPPEWKQRFYLPLYSGRQRPGHSDVSQCPRRMNLMHRKRLT